MNTHKCTSKYHVGVREQSSDRGRKTKSEHYQGNRDMYKQLSLKSRLAQIEKDQGQYYMYTTALRRAKRYGLEFTITLDDIQVPRVCPVLHIPLLYDVTGKRTSATPSLDRIDNSLGYVPGNVSVISWKANHLKRDLMVEDIKRLYEYMVKNDRKT